MFDLAGCIHFHSSYSYDASVPLAQILEDAVAAGLDYAIVTDHFRLDALRDGWEGYFPKPENESLVQGPTRGQHVLCLVGEEISPRYNHYLAFDIKEPVVVSKNHAHPQDFIDQVDRQGGFGFIAHPDHGGAPLVGTRAFPWTAWDVNGYAGIGLWDLMGDWSSSMRSPWAVLAACLWPARVLGGPKRETLERWDTLTQKSHCVAIGESDNHGTIRRYFGLRRHAFPFDFAFRAVRTHVLLEQPLTGQVSFDRSHLYQAIREGSSYVSLDLWNDPTGFVFEIFDERNRATMGKRFSRQGPALIDVKLSQPGHLRLLRNGKVIAEERRRAYVERDLELPGVYRVEVDQWVKGKWRPWIFSNPIWVD